MKRGRNSEHTRRSHGACKRGEFFRSRLARNRRRHADVIDRRSDPLLTGASRRVANSLIGARVGYREAARASERPRPWTARAMARLRALPSRGGPATPNCVIFALMPAGARLAGGPGWDRAAHCSFPAATRVATRRLCRIRSPKSDHACFDRQLNTLVQSVNGVRDPDKIAQKLHKTRISRRGSIQGESSAHDLVMHKVV